MDAHKRAPMCTPMDEYTGEELDRLIRSTIADLDVDLAAFLPGPAELAAMLNASLDPEP